MAAFDLSGARLRTPDGYAARMLVLTGPAESDARGKPLPYRKNVVVSAEEMPEGTTTEAYMKAQLGVMSLNMEGFRRLKTSTITIGGASWPVIEAQSLGPQGVLYGQLIAYGVQGRTAWTLSASHLLGPQFNAAREEYLALFSRFEVDA